MTIQKLSNPPVLSNLAKPKPPIALPNVLRGTFADDGINDDWAKWMQQVTYTVNQLIVAADRLEALIKANE